MPLAEQHRARPSLIGRISEPSSPLPLVDNAPLLHVRHRADTASKSGMSADNHLAEPRYRLGDFRNVGLRRKQCLSGNGDYSFIGAATRGCRKMRKRLFRNITANNGEVTGSEFPNIGASRTSGRFCAMSVWIRTNSSFKHNGPILDNSKVSVNPNLRHSLACPNESSTRPSASK